MYCNAFAKGCKLDSRCAHVPKAERIACSWFKACFAEQQLLLGPWSNSTELCTSRGLVSLVEPWCSHSPSGCPWQKMIAEELPSPVVEKSVVTAAVVVKSTLGNAAWQISGISGCLKDRIPHEHMKIHRREREREREEKVVTK